MLQNHGGAAALGDSLKHGAPAGPHGGAGNGQPQLQREASDGVGGGGGGALMPAIKEDLWPDGSPNLQLKAPGKGQCCTVS